MTLTQAEETILHRDVALQVGDEDAVRVHEERAAGLACVALSRVADEFVMPDVRMSHDTSDPFLRGVTPYLPTVDAAGEAPGSAVNMIRFREMEAHILRLAGLGDELAAKHLDGALAAYRDGDPERFDDAEDVRRALLRAADAACTVQGSLARERRGAASRHRRRRNIRRCLLALGGATIAVANPLALPLIGPFAVAASAALGGGAAGAVANLIEG